MKILIAYPGKFVRKYLNNRTDIVYLDGKGWWIPNESGNGRRLVDVFSIAMKLPSQSPIKIIDKLRELGPIWVRWVSQADQYELLFREALIYILHIIAGLAEFGIKKVIFHTGVSHHLDSSFIEIACSEVKIPQVFLYFTVINNRLLPLVQAESIADRKPLGAIVSKYTADHDITSFLQNKLKGKSPIYNPVLKKYQHISTLGMIRLLYEKTRHSVGRIKNHINNKMEDEFFNVFPVLGFSEHLRLIKNQKRGLEFYNKNCGLRTDIEQYMGMTGSLPLFIIAAHFQPEATSFPEGGKLNNHIDIVITLRSLGYDKVILYKEHPTSFTYFDNIVGALRVGIFRSVSYYKRLIALGCKFVRPEMAFSLNAVDNSWFIPLTITGSIGVERSIAGFSTVYTGHPWYKGIPGAVHISNAINLLQNGRVCASREIADGAFDFLEGMLSNTTITNAPGLANGLPIDDKDILRTFMDEFDALIDSLKDESQIITDSYKDTKD